MPPWLFQASHLQSGWMCQAKRKYNEPNQNNIAWSESDTSGTFFLSPSPFGCPVMSGSLRTCWFARPASCVGIINAQINRELTLRTGVKRSLTGTMAAFVCVRWGLGGFKKVAVSLAFWFLCLHVGAMQLWKLDGISVFQEFCFEVTSLACFSRPATFRLVGGSHAAVSPIS